MTSIDHHLLYHRKLSIPSLSQLNPTYLHSYSTSVLSSIPLQCPLSHSYPPNHISSTYHLCSLSNTLSVDDNSCLSLLSSKICICIKDLLCLTMTSSICSTIVYSFLILSILSILYSHDLSPNLCPINSIQISTILHHYLSPLSFILFYL